MPTLVRPIVLKEDRGDRRATGSLESLLTFRLLNAIETVRTVMAGAFR
jgi:hypothetical protein